MPERLAWRSPGYLPEDPKDLSRILTHYLADLERYIYELHREVSFGPLAGAYFPVDLQRSSTGASLPTGTVDGSFFDFEMRPVHVSLVCFGGDLTADVVSQSSSILSAGAVSLAAGVQQTFNQRGDFAVDKVTNDLSLSIVSIDSGTPTHVRVIVTNKNVSKVEPA